MTCLIRCSFLCLLVFLAGPPALRAQDYFPVQQIDQAKAQAHARHLPIAWMSSPMVYLNRNFANEAEGTPAELTALALRTLQGQAVVIFQNADADLPNMPANMIDRIETRDEGNDVPGGGHYTAPKIIYTDPELKTFFACTIAPDLRSDREAAINIALLHIRNDPQAQALINGTAPAATTAPANRPPAPPPPPASVAASVLAMILSGSFLLYAAGTLLVLMAVVAFIAWRSRS